LCFSPWKEDMVLILLNIFVLNLTFMPFSAENFHGSNSQQFEAKIYMEICHRAWTCLFDL